MAYPRMATAGRGRPDAMAHAESAKQLGWLGYAYKRSAQGLVDTLVAHGSREKVAVLGREAGPAAPGVLTQLVI